MYLISYRYIGYMSHSKCNFLYDFVLETSFFNFQYIDWIHKNALSFRRFHFQKFPFSAIKSAKCISKRARVQIAPLDRVHFQALMFESRNSTAAHGLLSFIASVSKVQHDARLPRAVGKSIGKCLRETKRESFQGAFEAFAENALPLQLLVAVQIAFMTVQSDFVSAWKKKANWERKSGNFQQHFHQFSFPVSPQFRCNSFVQLQSIRQTHVSIAKMWDQ